MTMSVTRVTASVGLAVAAIVALAGCVPGAPIPTVTPTATAIASPSATAAPAPALVDGGTATENQPFFDQTNLAYFAANGKGTGQGIVSSLVAAGFRKQDMQLTADRTAIDLEADSIIVSVRLKGQCLIGDFRASGYSSSVASLLGNGSCLIGTTVPIP